MGKMETFLDTYMYLDRGASSDDTGIDMTGRVHSIRQVGKNLVFIDLHQSDFRVQIKAHKESYESDFHADLAKIQRGDVIACVNGFPNKTKVASTLSGKICFYASRILSLKSMPKINLHLWTSQRHLTQGWITCKL